MVTKSCLLFSIALVGLSSCTTNYLVDPVPTPVFTGPWQGSVQANVTTDSKYCFEGECSLPMNGAIVVSREFWRQGIDQDQQMTNIGLGRFWTSGHSSILLLGGFGAGSARSGPDDVISLPFMAYDVGRLDSRSDFRKYFAVFEYGVLDTPLVPFSLTPVGVSYGIASRIEYLDRYNFSQRETSFGSTSDSTHSYVEDTTTTYDNLPKHSWNIDLVAFYAFGVSAFDLPSFQIYTQVLIRIPLGGYQLYMDRAVATVGVQFSF